MSRTLLRLGSIQATVNLYLAFCSPMVYFLMISVLLLQIDAHWSDHVGSRPQLKSLKSANLPEGS